MTHTARWRLYGRLVARTKLLGDLAELEVAADLVARGYGVCFPYGEDADYDLVVDRRGQLERVQVKYGRSDGIRLEVRCRSHSLTNGRVRETKRYTSRTIDWLAVWDASTRRSFYIPAVELGEGRSLLTLRLVPAANGQLVGIHMADDYTAI